MTATPALGTRQPVAPHNRGSLSPDGGTYRFTGGFSDAHRGVKLLLEHVSDAQDAANFAQVTQLLDQIPLKILKRVSSVGLLARQDEAYDRYYERAYKIPGFQAVAAGGWGTITFFGGKLYSVGTMFHEFGHNLSVNQSAWKRAIEQDNRTIAALAARAPLSAEPFELVPDKVRQERWQPRLAPGGLTPYGEGRTGEDIAEGIRLLLSERHFGRAFATIGTGADARPLTFAEAYPARTKLLEQAARFDFATGTNWA